MDRMAGAPLALERSYGCLNCDFWDYGDGQDYCAFAFWGCRSAVGTGLEDGRFVCCWVVQELGGGARTGAGPGSAGQEGGRVVRGEGLGAEGDEVSVVGGGKGVDGLGGGEGLLAEGFSFAVLCGVENEDAVGEGGDAGVAAGGGGGGWTAEAVGEGGEEQEAAGGERIAPGAGNAHIGKAAGGADYDG